MPDIIPGNNHLSVETGSGFTFVAACDRTAAKCVDTEIILHDEPHGTPVFHTLLQKSQWLKTNPYSISLAVCTPKSALIPLELFDVSQKEKYLSLNCELLPEETVWHQTVHSIQSEIVFAIPSSFKRDFERAFPAVVFRHSASLVIDYIQSFINAKPSFFVNFYPGLMQVAVMDNRKLLFFNSFIWKTAEDVVYYLLFSAEQLKLSASQVRIMMMGEINTEDPVHRLVSRYFDDTGFCPAVKGIDFSDEMKKHPSHRFLNLINQFACEL